MPYRHFLYINMSSISAIDSILYCELSEILGRALYEVCPVWYTLENQASPLGRLTDILHGNLYTHRLGKTFFHPLYVLSSSPTNTINDKSRVA